MTGPLILLAVLSVAGGSIGIPAFIHNPLEAEVAFNPMVAVISSIAAVAGLALAYAFYGAGVFDPEEWAERFKTVRSVLIHKFYIDDLYDRFIVQTVQQGIASLSNLFERYVIIGFFVNGTAWTAQKTGGALRRLQTGLVHTYVLFFMAGVTALLYVGVFLMPMGGR